MAKNKKDLSYYLSLPYRMELIPDLEEGGYTVCFPELPGCLTCGETTEEAFNNAQEAKKEWLKAALEDGIEIDEPCTEINSSEYSGQFKLRIPKSLHHSLAKHAKREGISMNQYCLYLLAKNDY
ncbi:MAG: type II toxin-antitoxin system HicB family antitoxin [Lachnospiraceae bacterium]|nr:type II toxin-antitoxin system HicB family antitoxin [Lachnospiraceae bacterium]